MNKLVPILIAIAVLVAIVRNVGIFPVLALLIIGLSIRKQFKKASEAEKAGEEAPPWKKKLNDALGQIQKEMGARSAQSGQGRGPSTGNGWPEKRRKPSPWRWKSRRMNRFVQTRRSEKPRLSGPCGRARDPRGRVAAAGGRCRNTPGQRAPRCKLRRGVPGFTHRRAAKGRGLVGDSGQTPGVERPAAIGDARGGRFILAFVSVATDKPLSRRVWLAHSGSPSGPTMGDLMERRCERIVGGDIELSPSCLGRLWIFQNLEAGEVKALCQEARLKRFNSFCKGSRPTKSFSSRGRRRDFGPVRPGARRPRPSPAGGNNPEPFVRAGLR